MGHGIAQVFAQAGLEVFLQDVEASALDRATSSITRSLEKLVTKEKLTVQDAELTRLRVTTTTDLDALSGVSLDGLLYEPKFWTIGMPLVTF